MSTPRPVPLAVLCALALACARQPVLYPESVEWAGGPDAAEAAIAECQRQVDDYLANDGARVGQTAADTAVGAGAGAAAGAVGGAISGGAGVGAAVGAASGATYSFVRSLFRRRDPDPVRKRLVERCLADEGYEVAGWR